MKTKNGAIALVVIALLILLGAGGYLMINNKSGTSSKPSSQETTKTTEANQTTKSLLDLIKMGQNLRCTFKSEVKNGSTEGTVYVSGQNVRGDFNVTSESKTIQTSMIRVGDTNYIWGSDMTTTGGIKMTIALDKLSQNQQNTANSVDPNQKVDYKCSPWNVDKSLFTPPTDIKFTDMTSLLAPKETGTAVKPSSTETQSNNPCSQIEDANVKAACEAALEKAGQ